MSNAEDIVLHRLQARRASWRAPKSEHRSKLAGTPFGISYIVDVHDPIKIDLHC